MKKIFVFIAILILVLAVITVPTFMAYRKYAISEYYTTTQNDQGTNLSSVMVSSSNLLTNNTENVEDVVIILREYTNILEGRNKDTMNLFLIMSITIFVLTIFCGILFAKKYGKVIGAAFITAAVISALLFGFLYWAGITNVIIF